jgi:crossover junction endodeoxyribonuclease RusA
VRESNEKVGPWRERVALAAYEAKNAMEGGFVLPVGPVVMELEFVLYRPKATPKSKTTPATKAPDIDTLCRAILDALTNVIYRDDAQVVHLDATKRVAKADEEPGVHIWVGEG